jgi:flagellar protein FlaG
VRKVNIGTVGTDNATSKVPVAAKAVRHEPSEQVQDIENDAVRKERLKEMIDEMQVHIDSMNVSLQYSTYGDHGEKVAISVVNKDTGEVIREIPPKEIRNLYAKMSELAGMIFNINI